MPAINQPADKARPTLAALLILSLAGCKSQQPTPQSLQSIPKAQESWSTQPLATPPQPLRPVKEGSLLIAKLVVVGQV